MATPEEELQAAADLATIAANRADGASQQFYDVANGDATSTVTTDNGEVDTVAKAIQEIKDTLVGATLEAQIEEQTLSAGQTTVTLTTLTAEARPLMYIEGSFEQDFTVTNETTIELGQSYPDGTRVWFLQNSAIQSITDSFVQTLGTTMVLDPTVLGAKTLGTSSDNTLKITIGGTDYFIPVYTTAP